MAKTLTYSELVTLGRELDGIFTDGGINWRWFSFRTEHAAHLFDVACMANGYETRGVYPPHHYSVGMPADMPRWGVRFR